MGKLQMIIPPQADQRRGSAGLRVTHYRGQREVSIEVTVADMSLGGKVGTVEAPFKPVRHIVFKGGSTRQRKQAARLAAKMARAEFFAPAPLLWFTHAFPTQPRRFMGRDAQYLAQRLRELNAA